ncbi:MAG: caspase family protein [Proteobacteria bacterium]|nr:caspase family protein [Pseudomonadota bacterium]MDA1357703.1 caspase family protein [Pseudomonadota bacterium]
MFRIAFAALSLIFMAALSHEPVRAATSEFDGNWSLTIGRGCVGSQGFPAGNYEAVIENGRLKGQVGGSSSFGGTGSEESLKGEIEEGGQLRDGKLGFRVLNGRIDGNSGAGMLQFRNMCLAEWQLTRLSPPPVQNKGSEFDGRWAITFESGCDNPGRYEAVINNGVLSAVIPRRGRDEKLKALIDGNGNFHDSRLGVRNFTGQINGTAGSGVVSHRTNCLAGWDMALVEATNAAPVRQAAQTREQKPVAVATDDVAPLIDTQRTVQTEGSVIELTGRVSDSSTIIEFTVNGAASALQADGGFYIKRGVAQGQSELVIAALDEWGNRAERRVQVTRSAQSVTRNADSNASATASNADNAAPMIALAPSIETSEAIIEITGGIIDSSAVVDVRVGGRSVPLNADGTFSIRRGVAIGESELVVTALDEWGNEAEKRIRITRHAPAVEPVEELQTTAITEETGDRQAPRITLPDKLETEGPEIIIAGSVADDSAVSELFVNERPVRLRADGSFRVSQALKIGVNKFAFTAIDEWGNKASATVDVMRQQLDLALGKYHALVIGNNDYGDMPILKTAIADAEAISAVLEDRYGFTVTKLINATRFDVISAMSDLRASLSYDTNLLIYYAGHGIVDPVTDRGYWLPVDAHQSNSANWVSNDDITDMLKAIPARHILVIADSCYSGTLVRAAPADFDTWEDRRDWLKRIVEKRSRTALASGGLEPVADAGGGNHSVFAAALLGVLQENTEIVEATVLFAPVRKKVVLNADQTPVYSDIRLAGHDGGDFIFAPK